MKKTIEDFYLAASGQVLTRYLPNHWEALTDERMDYWLESHAWEPFQYWPAKQLWEQITSVAHALFEAYKEGIHDAKNK